MSGNIEIRNLTFTYPGSENPVLKDVFLFSGTVESNITFGLEVSREQLHGRYYKRYTLQHEKQQLLKGE